MEKTIEEKWKEYQDRFEKLFIEGFKKGLILPYDEKLIDSLREIYYGGLPLSIILLSRQVCNGNCYDMALLMTLGFENDDYRLVDADVNSITLRPDYSKKYGSTPHYGNHCFVERTDENGICWVYDTSSGFIIERNLYYQMENPVITKINDRDDIHEFRECLGIDGKLKDEDMGLIPFILLNIEESDNSFGFDYSDILQREIEMFKEFIDYDDMQAKLDEGVKSFYR